MNKILAGSRLVIEEIWKAKKTIKFMNKGKGEQKSKLVSNIWKKSKRQILSQ